MDNDSATAYQTYSARVATFEQPQQLSKRRASSQGKKKAHTIAWPHQYPTPQALANAGFYYKPSQDSPDNVQCFTCAVKLDGWEATDNPLEEHLSHSTTCAWAICQSTMPVDGQDLETHDPMDERMVAARRATYEIGAGWVHEGKRGWRCKISKLAAAGWCFDPSPDTDDGTTCFYCNLSLDGWEPKDDPLEEHRKRAPGCRFFALLEMYGESAPAKGKSRAKGKGRGSTASRLSVQSVVSIVPSEAPSVPESAGDAIGMDDDTTSTSHAGGKGKKNGVGRPKKAAKRKIVSTADEHAVQYPDLDAQSLQQEDGIRLSQGPLLPEESNASQTAAKRTRIRHSRQPDSSVVEISHLDAAPKKAPRARKAKQAPVEEPEVPIEAFEQRLSEVSAQLQADLEHSLQYPDAESTPQAVAVEKPKRGVKRMSTGALKRDTDGSVTVLQFPVPPKAKRGPKSRTSFGSADDKDQDAVTAAISDAVTSAIAVKPIKGKKAPAKKGKGRKASSTRSSKASTTIVTTRSSPEVEDLERDEREIEAELERIALEQQEAAAIQAEQDRTAEYEPSPSHVSQAAAHIRALEQELQAEVSRISMPGQNMAQYVASVAAVSPAVRVGSDIALYEDAISPPRAMTATPSPAASDKENIPSSALPVTAMEVTDPTARLHLSPTKITRVPLALGTPKHCRMSPSKLHLSPSKINLTSLTSTLPWTAVDLDTVFLASPQATPGRLNSQLVAAAGLLSEKERAMDVEQWIRFRAEAGEAELRRKCDGMVEAFEREAGRGLEVLSGIRTEG